MKCTLMRYIPEFRGDDVLILQVINVMRTTCDQYITKHICSFLDYKTVIDHLNYQSTDIFIDWTWKNATANIKLDITSNINPFSNDYQFRAMKHLRIQDTLINDKLDHVKPILSLMGPMDLTFININTTFVNMNKFFCWMRQLDNIDSLEFQTVVFVATMEELATIFQIHCNSISFKNNILDKATKSHLCHFQRICKNKSINVKTQLSMDI